MHRINSTEVKALTDSYISYEEFVLVNNLLKEHDEKKKRNEKFKSFIK